MLTADEKRARKAARARQWYADNKARAKAGRKAYYRKNLEARRGYMRARMQRVLASRRRLVFLLKMRPCADCGLQWPPAAMDLDHMPGTKKVFDLSAIASKNEEQIIAEAAKCEVVCACCHRMRTEIRAGRCS